MKVNKILLFFYIISCFSANSYAQYIQVDDTYTAQQLVENVLINSPCANVSNFSVSGGNFGSAQKSFGYFSDNASGFPFLDGIILSTCRAVSAIGPNTSTLNEDALGWGADADLENALSISGTSNATILEFDFIPLTSKISFKYIFASEEYHDTASCVYSDGFAFLLKPAAGTAPYQNLALVPNTNTPVKVTTVHPDIPGGCPAINETYFDAFNGTAYPTNFNGQTVIMSATATVIPGTTYHIKLVIADEANPKYDSAIFLGGGSFNVGTDLGPDQLIATQNPVCQGKTHPLDATEAGASAYKWYRNNIAIPGGINPTYLVTMAGVYKVEVTLGTTTCIATGEVTIEYSTSPILTSTTLVQCDDNADGSTVFNLSSADNIIKNNDSTLGPVVYYENLIAAQNQDNSQAIANPMTYQSVPKTIYASVSNADGCFNTANVDLQIANNSVAPFRDLETCDLDTIDGFYDFNLRVDGDPKILMGLPAGLVVEYYESMNDAIAQTNMLPNIYRNSTPFQMYVYARIINGSDCYGVIPLHLFVNSINPEFVEEETIETCDGQPQTLSIASIFGTYIWSNGDIDSETVVTTAGIYTVTVTDVNTCQATKTFNIINFQSPTITSVEIDDFQDSNTVLINYTGIGINEFSLDGIYFQSSPFFSNVAAGSYTVWIRNGCGTDFRSIFVFGYPKFFTPNGDGFNDIWTIDNISFIPHIKINIYDRFGKFIYQFTGNQKGWDGFFNSKEMPSNDYWFFIDLENQKTVKGHFTLKR